VGIALEGATLQEDLDDNTAIYGHRLDNREIVSETRQAPQAVAKLVGLLNKYSPREEKNASQ
jgi:lipid-binding SYLF domain-containing protein